MRLLLILILFMIEMESAMAGSIGKNLKIAVFDFCPWQCPSLKDSEVPGISVEIAKRIFEKEGYKIQFIPMPYTRAIKGTEEGDYDVILNLNALTSSKVLKSKEPSAYMEMNFYVRKDEKWHYTGVNSLKDIKVISILGYNYNPLSPSYQKYLSENDKSGKVIFVSGDNAPERAFRMVLAKRATTFNEDASVFEYVTFKASLRDSFKKVETLGGGPLFAGFSPHSKSAPLHQAQFDKGIQRLRKEGALKKIFARYKVMDRTDNKRTVKSAWDKD